MGPGSSVVFVSSVGGYSPAPPLGLYGYKNKNFLFFLGGRVGGAALLLSKLMLTCAILTTPCGIKGTASAKRLYLGSPKRLLSRWAAMGSE